MPVQIFWASPKIWLHLVPLQNLLCRHKKQFYWMQIIFLSGTKCLWLPQYLNKFLVWHKKIGPAQNILEPVKGKGMSFLPSLKNDQKLSVQEFFFEYVIFWRGKLVQHYTKVILIWSWEKLSWETKIVLNPLCKY